MPYVPNAPWKAEFVEHGGYDCKSDAWVIRGLDGRHIATIDLADTPNAEQVAKIIVTATRNYSTQRFP